MPGREPARMTRDRSLPVNTGGSSERRQTGWQWRSRARTRYVSRMGPIVGYDAAPLLHMAVTQLLTGYALAMFVLLPLAVFAQVIPDAWLWLPFGITLAPLARALHRTRRLIRQATTTARPFLSARYGVEFPPPPGNTSPAPWRSFINKVLREHGQSPPFE